MTRAEWTRKAVHAGFGLAALALRFLDWKAAAALAVLALLGNLFVPRVRGARAIYRDAARRHDAGINAYPAMVLLPPDLPRALPPIAAAVGDDGSATAAIVGEVGRRPAP